MLSGIVNYNKNTKKMKKALEVISASGLLSGLVFKLFHWPGCDLLLIFSLGLFIPIVYLTELVTEWKSATSKYLLVINFMLLFTLTEGILFKLMHWPGGDMLFEICLGLLLPLYFLGKAIIFGKDRKGILLNAVFYAIFSICILFVFLHLPGVDAVLLFSFGVLLVSVISSLLRKESVQLIDLNFSKNNSKITFLVVFSFLYLLGSRVISKRILDNECYVQYDLQEKFQLEKQMGDRFVNETNKEKAALIDTETADLISLIDNVKRDIISNVDFDLWKRPSQKQLELFEINLLEIDNKFNKDVPRQVILGSGGNGLEKYASGAKIWKSFLAYQDFLMKNLKKENQTNNLDKGEYESMCDINAYWKNKDYADYYEVKSVNWMERSFGTSTVLQSIVKLTEMQLEIIRMRNLALSGL